MSVRATPVWIQSGGETAADARRAMQAIFGGRGGVVGVGDLAVTQTPTPSMAVSVASGQVVIPGSQDPFQGVYVVENQGVLNLPVAAADPTNPRVDLVVARVQDAQYSGQTNSASMAVVTGTPAPSPTDPPVPATAWVLARVAVAANASSITNANITDLRTQRAGQEGSAAALGGVIACTSTTRPAHAVGRPIYETDTGRLLISDGSAWTGVPRTGTGSGTISTGSNNTTVVITFSPAFPQTPTVIPVYDSSLGGTPGNFGVRLTAVSASSATVTVYRTDGSTSPSNQGVTFRWAAFA